MIPASDPRAPHYWMYESSGVLAPVVRKYLRGDPLRPEELGLLRAYFRQWVESPVWDRNPHGDAESRRNLNALRGAISGITDREHAEAWIARAVELGLDPL